MKFNHDFSQFPHLPFSALFVILLSFIAWFGVNQLVRILWEFLR